MLKPLSELKKELKPGNATRNRFTQEFHAAVEADFMAFMTDMTSTTERVPHSVSLSHPSKLVTCPSNGWCEDTSTVVRCGACVSVWARDGPVSAVTRPHRPFDGAAPPRVTLHSHVPGARELPSRERAL